MNGMKEAGTNSEEGLLPGRCPTEQQGGPSRHGTRRYQGGRRRKWSQKVNRILMECYYNSNPEVEGYIERMYMIWKEKRMFDIKEQRLSDEKWQIVTKKWFSDLKLNEIREKLMGVTEEFDENGCEGSIEFGEEDNVENECHVVLEDTCLNQNRYSRNDEWEVVSRTVLQGDEIEIFEQLIYKKEKKQLKTLRGIPKAKVKCAVKKRKLILEN